MRTKPLRFRCSGLAATLAGVVLQVAIIACAHAAPVYRCIGAHGETAFQAEPCAAVTGTSVVEVHEQPMIDPSAPPVAVHYALAHGDRQRKSAMTARISKRAEKTPVSYECRAADGEVFYRHSRCLGTIKGDGIARFGVDVPQTPSHRGRKAGGAWAAVKVTSRKIAREEACRQINALTASGRDGYERDEQVSVYDHDLGRDPCD